MRSFPKSSSCADRPRRAISIEALEPRAYFSVDLTGSISVVPPASGAVKPGGHITLAIEITNNGTTAAVEQLGTTLSVTLSPDGSSPISLGSVNKHIRLQPGAQTSFRVNEKIPKVFTPGVYYAVGDIDPANTFGESNVANNVVVSANTVSVVSLFRNIIGTLVGTAIIKKGVDKGLVINQTVTNTSEDFATGIVSFTGTNTFPNGAVISFAGTTTLKTNGSYTVVGADVPADSSGTFMDVAKLVGNTAKGRFVNAVNSGTFTQTFVS